MGKKGSLNTEIMYELETKYSKRRYTMQCISGGGFMDPVLEAAYHSSRFYYFEWIKYRFVNYCIVK